MIKKYVKGNKLRGKEVIKILTDLGGKNHNLIQGNGVQFLYYIGHEDKICSIDSEHKSFMLSLILETFEEIKLKEPYVEKKVGFKTAPQIDDNCIGCCFIELQGFNCQIQDFNIMGINCVDEEIIFIKE